MKFFNIQEIDREFPRAFDRIENRMVNFLFFVAGQHLYACPQDALVSNLIDSLEFYNPDSDSWENVK